MFKKTWGIFVSFISAHSYELILVLVWLIVSIENYSSGTWLSGWDTLHQEFNFWLNLKRELLGGIWREYQGLGAVAGHSHTSDIVRQTFLILGGSFLPTTFLRYSYIFLTLLIGPLGVFWLVQYLISTKPTNSSISDLVAKISAFLAGLFYMLNLGTLQVFNLPFEMFNTQFAFIPYVFLFSIRYLDEKRPRHLLYLFLVSLLMLPSGYAGTLFYIFYGLFACFLFLYSSVDGERIGLWQRLRKIVAPLVVVLAVNIYWILPNLYFVVTKSTEVSLSKINYIFSDEAFAKNKEFGNLKDISLQKNFLFDWSIYDFNKHSFVQVMEPWNLYFDSHKSLEIILFIYPALILCCLILILAKKDKKWLGFGFLIFVIFVLLFTENGLFGPIFKWLRDNVGVLREALRFPYSKLGIIYTLSIAVLLGKIFYSSLSFVFKRSQLLFGVLVSLAFLANILVMYPAFQGEYLNSKVKIKFPASYFEMFTYVNSLPEGRIAVLPINTLWPWVYYDWGYQGSGFLQFGLKNPILDRDFDRWNLKNEAYYKEITYAFYSRDQKLFNDVLKKYNVKYILFDKHVFNPDRERLGRTTELSIYDQMLEANSVITKINAWDENKILVYKTNLEPMDTYTGPVDLSTNVNSPLDSFYSLEGDYYSFPNSADSTISIPGFTNPNYLNELKELKIENKNFENYANFEAYLPISVFAKISDNDLEIKLIPAFAGSNLLEIFETVTFDIGDRREVFVKAMEKIFHSERSDLENTEFVKLGSFFASKGAVTIELLDFSNTLVDFIKDANFIVTDCDYQSGESYGYSVINGELILTGESAKLCLETNLTQLISQIAPGNQKYVSIAADSPDSIAMKVIMCFKWGACELIPQVFDPALLIDKTLRLEFDRPSSPYSKLVENRITSLKVLQIETKTSQSVNTENIFLKLADIPGTSDFNSFLQSFEEENDISVAKSNNAAEGFKFEQDVLNTTLISGQNSATMSFGSNLKFIRYMPYLINIGFQSLDAVPLRICYKNDILDRCFYYNSLKSGRFVNENFIVPNHEKFDSEEELVISSVPISNVIEKNVLSRKIFIYPLPLKFLGYLESTTMLTNSTQKAKIFTNDQTYDPGWILLCGQGICGKHVIVNGWENGWLLNENQMVRVLFFWPDLLEYFGILILIITGTVIATFVFKNTRS